jgi:hypothetical protein
MILITTLALLDRPRESRTGGVADIERATRSIVADNQDNRELGKAWTPRVDKRAFWLKSFLGNDVRQSSADRIVVYFKSRVPERLSVVYWLCNIV